MHDVFSQLGLGRGPYSVYLQCFLLAILHHLNEVDQELVLSLLFEACILQPVVFQRSPRADDILQEQKSAWQLTFIGDDREVPGTDDTMLP
jgi:hypothetical protein